MSSLKTERRKGLVMRIPRKEIEKQTRKSLVHSKIRKELAPLW